MRINRAFLPNMLTFSNLLLGFGAILFISSGRFTSGAWLIIAASLLDGLDGTVARLVKSASRFGAELDSLADMVSFGVAPSILIYHMLYEPFGAVGIVLSFLPLAAGAARLARFNVLAQSMPNVRGFIGMPIPGAALTLVGVFMYSYRNPEGLSTMPIWLSLIPAVSLLMLSPIPYRKPALFSLPSVKHPAQSLLMLAVIAAAVIFKPAKVLLPLMMVYVLLGPVEWIWKMLRQGEVKDIEEEEDDDEVRPVRRFWISRRRQR